MIYFFGKSEEELVVVVSEEEFLVECDNGRMIVSIYDMQNNGIHNS